MRLPWAKRSPSGRGRARLPHPRMDPLLEELRALYRETDALSAGWSCPSSTECCRFGITGREPYVTSLELAALRRARGAQAPRAPGAHGPKVRKRALRVVDGERPCPMLS